MVRRQPSTDIQYEQFELSPAILWSATNQSINQLIRNESASVTLVITKNGMHFEAGQMADRTSTEIVDF